MRWLHAEVEAPLLPECYDKAARLGDVELVEWLRERDVPLNTAQAALEAAWHGQLAMIQHLDNITTEPWSTESTGELLGAAVQSGHVQTCEWLHKRFPEILNASSEQWVRYDGVRLTLPCLRWAIDRGIAWKKLAGCRFDEELRCSHAIDNLSCEAWHWAHEDGLANCTCPAHGHEDEAYEQCEEGWEYCNCDCWW